MNPLLDSGSTLLLLVLGVGIGVAIFILTIVVLSLVTYKETPVRDRMMSLKGELSEDYIARNKDPFSMLKEGLINFSEPISKSLYGKDKSMLDKTKAVLTEAGVPDGERHVWRLMATCVATAIALMVIGTLVGSIITQDITMGLIAGIVGALIGLRLPTLSLRHQAKKRKDEIRYNLPDTLDFMVVCVEAGLALDSTIMRVADETKTMAPDISHELSRVNRDLNAGIPRIEAFQNLGTRAGVDELRSLCALIIQSDKLGTSIGTTLRVYADDLRVKRRQRAETLASKASIKMTIPLVFFIFPALFIVLTGSAVINMIETFSKTPGG